MFQEEYVQQKLREIGCACEQPIRRNHVEPGSDIERRNVGVVHEVFRRIVGDAEPPRHHRSWIRRRAT